MNKEILYTDLYEAFEPKSQMTLSDEPKKWQVVPYEAESFSGNLLISAWSSSTGTLTLDPKLSGWYKIMLIFPDYKASDLYIKLSGDDTFSFRNSPASRVETMSEVFYRCADMTGQNLMITTEGKRERYAHIAGVRFVPMSDEDVKAYKESISNPANKRMYVCDDMNNHPLRNKMLTPEDWYEVVAMYDNSDVEWISPELFEFDAWYVPSHYSVANNGYTYYDALKKVTQKAHEKGIKIAPCIRMGHWGIGYPHCLDKMGDEFADAHPDMRCVDRNGDITSAMSYAYPEVRRHRIDQLLKMARCGADAVSLAACRGVPFVLFEKPVADEFYSLYGEYPYELPLDDERLNKLHCEIMARLFRELREALDNEFGKNKIQIHLVGLHTVDANSYVGLDVEKLANEGVLDAILPHPRRIYEEYDPSFINVGDEPRIDLDKYTEYVKQNSGMAFVYASVFPRPTSKGTMVGPASDEENCRQWADLSKKCGIEAYPDLGMVGGYDGTNEGVRKMAEKAYGWGVEKFSLWNAPTYNSYGLWDMIYGVIGHKDTISEIPAYPYGYAVHRVLSYYGERISRFQPIWGG